MFVVTCFVIWADKSIPIYIFYEKCFACVLHTLLTTEALMFFVFVVVGDDTSIALCVSTVVAVIGFFIAIDTGSDSCMCILITDLCAHTSIKCVEISEPISVIVLVGVFDHSSIDRSDIETCLSHEDRCFFASYSSRAVPDDFSTVCHFFIAIKQVWHFPKINRTCRNSSFEMTELIFIVISHIENEIFIFSSFIDDLFKVLSRDSFIVFLDIFGGYFFSKYDNLVALLYDHFFELMPISIIGFYFDISHLLEILRIREKELVCLDLSEISRNSRADSLSSDIDSSSHSDVFCKLEMFSNHLIDLILGDIYEMIKCEKLKLRFVIIHMKI